MNFLRQFIAWAACFAIASTAVAGTSSPRYDQKETQHLASTKPSLPIANYLGTYENEVYGQARVELDGQGRLRITGSRNLNGVLQHWENDTFRNHHDDSDGSLVQFIVDASHSVSAMQIDNTTVVWRIR